METATPRRTLIVANRTAATPLLMEEVRRRAGEQPTQFSLLIPNVTSKDHGDWTLANALELLERAARAPVEGYTAEEADPFEAVKRAVAEGDFEDILISTLSKRTSEWLRRDLPHRVEKLGLPVAVISQPAEKAPIAGVAGGGGGIGL